MITVRYPSGFSVQYNGANQTVLDGAFTRIREVRDGKEVRLFAQVPVSSGALIEYSGPCSTYDASTVDDSRLISLVTERLRRLSVYRLAELKRALRGFDAKKRMWNA